MVLNLCKHACKEVCDVNPGIDPYPLLARSCNRWWPDFVTFTVCKRSRFGLQGGKKAQCISNRCKDLFERKKYFGVRCTLNITTKGWPQTWLHWYHFSKFPDFSLVNIKCPKPNGYKMSETVAASSLPLQPSFPRTHSSRLPSFNDFSFVIKEGHSWPQMFPSVALNQPCWIFKNRGFAWQGKRNYFV